MDTSGAIYNETIFFNLIFVSVFLEESVGSFVSQGSAMQLYRCESCNKTVSSSRSLKRHRNTCKQYQLEYGQLGQKATDLNLAKDSRRLVTNAVKKNKVDISCGGHFNMMPLTLNLIFISLMIKVVFYRSMFRLRMCFSKIHSFHSF